MHMLQFSLFALSLLSPSLPDTHSLLLKAESGEPGTEVDDTELVDPSLGATIFDSNGEDVDPV